MNYAQTEFVLVIDVDFIPSQNMYHYVERMLRPEVIKGILVNLTTGLEQTQNWCYVVPAFEAFTGYSALPLTKENLIAMWNSSSVLPFRHAIWTAGHMATDYAKWKNSTNPYEVFWSADYEPYVVVRRGVLQFDEHFVGFGWNKASYAMALDALGYRFITLPEAFLIHLSHPPSIEMFRFRTSPLYRACVDELKLHYIKQLAKKHGVRALKYLEFRKERAD